MVKFGFWESIIFMSKLWLYTNNIIYFKRVTVEQILQNVSTILICKKIKLIDGNKKILFCLYIIMNKLKFLTSPLEDKSSFWRWKDLTHLFGGHVYFWSMISNIQETEGVFNKMNYWIFYKYRQMFLFFGY